MKKSLGKKLKIVVMTVAALSMLTGCGAVAGAKDEPLTTYTAESGMYSVSLPGEWKEEDNLGLADMMTLSRADGMEAVFIGMAKGQVLGQQGKDVKSLEDFFDYSDSMFLNGEAASTELKDAEGITFKGITSTISKEGTMTQTNGGSGKVFLECGETEDAYYLFLFSATKSFDKKMAAVKKSMTFEELEVAKPETLSDTLRWINASYAVITSLNGGDLSLVAGFEPGTMIESSMKSMLERDWEVTDKASLDESVSWLLSEGHNSDALSYLAEVGADTMSREELIAFVQEGGYGEEDQTVLLAAYDAKAAYGDQAISGWDLSRAMSMYGFGYLSGLYTYEEAMDRSLETAKVIQQTFGSWDDFLNSYFYGYSYWSGENPEDTTSQAYSRRQLYEELKAMEDSPYGVSWDTALQKEW